MASAPHAELTNLLRGLLTSVAIASITSCVSSVPVRSNTICAPEDSAAGQFVARWTGPARGDDFWVAHVASPFVQQALRSARIASLEDDCVSIADPERVLHIEVGLVLRLLALGLAHADDASFHDPARRLMALAQIETDADIWRARDLVIDLEGRSEHEQRSLERVTWLWPTSDPRPPSRNELAHAAIASTRAWLTFNDPDAAMSGVCMSGQPMALAFANPAAIAAYAIGMGADPADVEALTFDALREVAQ